MTNDAACRARPRDYTLARRRPKPVEYRRCALRQLYCPETGGSCRAGRSLVLVDVWLKERFCRKVGFLLRLSNTELLNITRLLVSTSAINRTLRQNHILSRGRPSSPADVRSSGPERAGRVQQPSYRRFAGFFFASCCLSVMTSFKALVWCRSCSFNSPSR